MVDLAVYSQGGLVTLNSIAERQDVSLNYLEQVFSALKKAGLVRSAKGAQGGYMLSKRPEQITAGDILRVLEGSLSIIDENMENETTIRNCIRMNVWDKIDEAVNHFVNSKTLEDLAKDYKDINGFDDTMYYI